MADREELALQVIDLAKAAVLADNHFLSTAVGRLHVVPMQLTTSFSTDGYFLAFDPKHLLARFKRTGLPPKRNLLHSVAHCLFLHPYVSASVDQALWNLACDIAAERVVNDLLGPLPGSEGFRKTLVFQQIERDMGSRISAEKVYRRLRDGWWDDCAGEWMGIMRSDAHDMWYAPAQSGDFQEGEGTGRGTDPSGGVGSREGNADSTQSESGSAGNPSDTRSDSGDEEREDPFSTSADPLGNSPTATEGNDPSHEPNRPNPAQACSQPATVGNDATMAPPEQSVNATGASSGSAEGSEQQASGADARSGKSSKGKEHGTDGGNRVESVTAQPHHFELRQLARPSARQQQDEWRQVATSLAVNLQTLSAKRGGKLSGFVEDLQDTAQQRASYERFLRQFAVPGEVMRLSDDEFDSVFYTYGMKLYGNIPLIEPLEYREERRVREFVIVIDTSASVQGDIVRSFVTATFDILKETEAFFDQVHVRILQCDAQVQTDDKITCLSDLQHWCRSMRVAGGGGTDFRPAFAYVDELVTQGEFHDLGGLVYFTDGYGTYPERMPAYPCAFVFHDENRHETRVPPWAVQIVLDSDTIRDAEHKRNP